MSIDKIDEIDKNQLILEKSCAHRFLPIDWYNWYWSTCFYRLITIYWLVFWYLILPIGQARYRFIITINVLQYYILNKWKNPGGRDVTSDFGMRLVSSLPVKKRNWKQIHAVNRYLPLFIRISAQPLMSTCLEFRSTHCDDQNSYRDDQNSL